jgi:signal transduction histidine kinase
MPSPSMLALPPLEFDSAQWRLPLCDTTAMDLAQIFVEANVARRAARFAAVLAVDPALAIWARLRAASFGENGSLRSTLNRIPPLAEWLAVGSLERCNWQSITAVVNFSADQQGRFASLVAESIGAAREATRGFPYDFAILQPLYLAVVTANWRQWLQTANPQQAVQESLGIAAGLPEKIVGGLAPSTEARQIADESWRRWLCEVPGVQSLLPPLIAHLRQLHESRSNFAAELQAAKLEAIKELAYGAGHELNNPLANIASRAQTLLQGEKDPERRRRLASINTQAFRAHEMLADMMLFARPPQPRFEQVDVIRLADEVLKELADEAAAQETVLQRLGQDGPLKIEADPMQLRVAFRALCVNSLEALSSGGQITIEVRRAECGQRNTESTPHSAFDAPNLIQVSVSDTGPGISPDIRDKIFDPFFSGREAGRGLGFGLSKCWRIVTLHGGNIETKSRSQTGAQFVITLPDVQGNHDS